MSLTSHEYLITFWPHALSFAGLIFVCNLKYERCRVIFADPSMHRSISSVYGLFNCQFAPFPASVAKLA